MINLKIVFAIFTATLYWCLTALRAWIIPFHFLHYLDQIPLLRQQLLTQSLTEWYHAW